jgi:hypothetical protein
MYQRPAIARADSSMNELSLNSPPKPPATLPVPRPPSPYAGGSPSKDKARNSSYFDAPALSLPVPAAPDRGPTICGLPLKYVSYVDPSTGVLVGCGLTTPAGSSPSQCRMPPWRS